MSLANFARFERALDRIVPVFLLTLGLSISAAFVAVIGVV